MIEWKDAYHAFVFPFEPIIVNAPKDKQYIAFLERQFSASEEKQTEANDIDGCCCSSPVSILYLLV
jgi:hypothetical protein